MNNNFKRLFLLTAVLMLLVGISAAAAADDGNTATTDAVSVDDTATDVDASAIDNNNHMEKNTQTKEVKKDSSTHIVNNDNVDDIFSGENYTLADDINDGDTLDFRGTIDKNHTLIINKAVNAYSSTKDALISLHSVSKDKLGTDPGNLFCLNIGASGSVVTDLYLYNTQFWVHNAHDILFANMTMYVQNQSIGGGVGQTAIRYSDNILMDNCTIYTENNGGSSSFVLTYSSNCTIQNSRIEGQGNVGNIVYVGNQFNYQDIPEGFVKASVSNKVINCTIIAPNTTSSCVPIQNTGTLSLLEENKLYTGGSVIQSGTNGTVRNNILNQGCGISLSANSTAYNNTVMGSGSTSIAANCTVTNNTLGKVTINGANVTFTDNKVKDLLTLSQPMNLKNNNLSAITLNVNSKNSNITDNNINGAIAVNAVNITIKENNINTTNETAVVVTTDGVVVANNSIYSATKSGNNAVKTSKTSTLIEGNTPDSMTFTITDETYSQFFDEKGELINPQVTSYSTLILDGTFNNKSFVLTNVTVTINGNDAVLNDGKILVTDQAIAVIDNITFVNTNIDSSVIFDTNYNILRNSRITKTFTNALAREVVIYGNNNRVEYNNITITGPSAPIDYNVYPSLSPVIGIAVLSSSNVIQYNNVRYTDTRTGYDGSSDLITVSGALNEAENNLVTRNNLTAVGSGYLYGLNLGVNANYNNLTYNTLNINSSFYTYGVNILQVPMRDNYIAYNTMYLKSDDTAYGVLANVWGAPEVTNFRIANNNITVESVNAYGLQLAGSSYSGITFKNINITSNTINVTGTYAMGIGLAMTDNVYLYRNTLNIKGQTNETNTYSWDTVQSTTAGVYSADGNNTRLTSELRYDVTNGPDVIFKNMNNSLINRGAFVSNNDNFILENVENSLVNSTNANTTTEAAVDLVNSNGNEIKSNVFRAGNVGGNDAVVCDDASVDNIIESNTPITTYVEVTPDVLCIGMSGTITAKAVDSNQNDVTGTFALSLNGQEVYTSSGTTLSYDYTPTQVGDLEVTVTFTPEESGYLSRVNETVISVVEYGAVITVDDVTADAGETVTLTASVKDVFGVAVTKGKVTFKVNGKTVKDAYGKVIYAKVTDGVATVEYTVPEDYTGKNFTITAVYSGSSGLAKVQNTSTLTVNSPEASIEFENDPVTASVGQTVTFTVKVTGDVSKVVFKINGKTVKDANGKVIYAKVVDGIASIDYVIPEDMKAKDYTLTAVTMGSERLTAEQTLTIIKQ